MLNIRIRFRKTCRILLCLLCLFVSGCAATLPEAREVSEGSLPAAQSPALTCIAWDVGKADAFLLYTENSAVVIDCGKKSFGDTFSEEIHALTGGHVDALIISHFDKDHVGGAAKLLKSCEVDRVYTTVLTKSSKRIDAFQEALQDTGRTEETVRENTSFTLDGVFYEILPPAKEDYDSSDSNNSSLAVRVTAGEKILLFTGDMEEERTFEFLSKENPRCDVLKVPHHGKKNPASEALIKAAGAEIALITSSEEEPEDEKLLRLLRQSGAAVYLTREGTVVLSVTDGVISVTQE